MNLDHCRTPTNSEPFDPARVRADFPILDQMVHGHPLVYLDNAATSQKPRQVIDALRHYYEHDNANVHRGVHELSHRASAAYEAARHRTAQFINAQSAQEIIFTRGTTEGLNLVAQAWGNQYVKAGDHILLTEMEHHSNIVPWQMLAERVGAKVRYLPIVPATGELDLRRLPEFLTPQVKVFALTHISNTLGVINPIQDLCARARQVGALTVIDAAQSAGHTVLDVQEIGCDFLAFSSHKMCGPTGMGVLFGRLEQLEATPPYQGGGDMISSVDFDRSTWNQVPHKFEAGTPHICGAIGLHAAMDYLEALGRPHIARYDQELGAYAYDGLSRLPGLRLFGPPTGRAGLVSFLMNEVHAHDLVTAADQLGVALRGGHHCNQPLMKKLGVPATARASFYFYNTRAEVDRFLAVLKEILKFFGAST